MLERLKNIKQKFIKSADTLSDAQLNRRIKIYKTLSLYYGAKVIIGGALIVAGIATLGLGAAGVALPLLPVWAGAGGLGIGALMTANAVIGNRAFEKTYKTYAREKTARQPEGTPQPASLTFSQGLKAGFDKTRLKAAALLPRKPANDQTQPAQKKNTP
ncbi:MAG: hypothetical protein Q8K65_06270 [Alphaproteobacteria bacterium]|nr:hypothetical protein [Alphaproteobacteria bacterium]